ncbi:MAG TPA: NDP-sugar synthase [Armatimonadota bacterium]|nr:NDP-sugar synthase [Armatimonadota bacterium]
MICQSDGTQCPAENRQVSQVLGLGLAAGKGVRFRPLTLKARGYLRAKAAVRFLGRRVLDWVISILGQQGMHDFIMITSGKENRYQIKSIVGYGEALDVRIRYSSVRYDRRNVGSADAVITNMGYFGLDDTIFVFPTDSVLDIDLPAMLAAHQRHDAVVTIAAAFQPAEAIAGRYGLIQCEADGRVRGFVEKPSLAQITALCGTRAGAPLPTNAGFYLMNAAMLRALCRDPEVSAARQEQFDIGTDLLPWLVKKGYPVYAQQIGRMGDLGNIPSYLETMLDVLHGRFQSMNLLLRDQYPGGGGLLIEPESLAMSDPISGLTLAEKIAQDLVTIIPPVRIGKYVRIYPGVTLSECNIDDDGEIYEEATIRRSSVGAGSSVGPCSVIEDTLTGIMVDIDSTHGLPILLKRYVAIGDEVIIRPGVTLSGGVTIHPRLKVPRGITIPPHTEVETAEEMLEYL